MTRLKLLFASLLVSLLSSLASAQTILTQTTLAAAISNSSTSTISLSSSTGVTAGSTVIYVADSGNSGEAMFVNSVSGTTLQVQRGYQTLGSAASHASGALVFIGPPYAFFTVQPRGSCTRSNVQYLPAITFGVYGTATTISDCLNGVWVTGQTSGATPTVVFSPQPGGAVLTGVGTSTATTDTSMYCVEAWLPASKNLTGIGLLNGTATTNGHRDAILYDMGGNLLAQSGTTTTTGTASQYQNFAFTTKYYAVGPASYFVCSQSQSSSDSLNLVVTADGNAGYYTQIYTGQTYGTIPATVTAPTQYTTAQGPYARFY